MPTDITPEERARAHALVLQRLVEGLWVRILSTEKEWAEEADAEADVMLEELEALLAHTSGRDAEVTQHVAIDIMEGSWKTIKATLASLHEPSGLELRPLDNKRRGRAPGRELPPGDDDAPAG